MIIKQTLEVFLSERKQVWINKKTKGKDIKDDKLSVLKTEADARYDRDNWIVKAIKEARPSITTHPSTFTHSDAKSTAIKFIGATKTDGLLRTGNVETIQKFDVFGNAATDGVVWDTYLFLMTKTIDDKLVIDHFREETQESKKFIGSFNLNYGDTRKKLLAVFVPPTSFKTSQYLKQVYFPVDGNYHLLSLLTTSSLLDKLKSNIDNMRFGEITKSAKEMRKTNSFHQAGYDDLFDLTVTAFGGTKPQNISILNSQNGGVAYLLASTPPSLNQRQIRLPTHDFFKNSLRPSQFKESFQTLHSLIIVPVNNVHIREGISNTLKYIIDQVLQRAFRIRATDAGWSNAEHYQSLPLGQRIWLDDAYLLQRENEDDWVNDITRSFARWLMQAYEYSCKDTHIKLSDHELREIRILVDEAVSNDQEFFK